MRMHTFEKKSTALVIELKFSDCHDDFFFQKHSMILKKKEYDSLPLMIINVRRIPLLIQ